MVLVVKRQSMDMHDHARNGTCLILENPNPTAQGTIFLQEIGLVLHVQYTYPSIDDDYVASDVATVMLYLSYSCRRKLLLAVTKTP